MDPPGLAPGYAPSQQYVAPTTQKSFVAGLFDFSFTTFITTRVLKALYVLFLVTVTFGLIGGVGAGFMTSPPAAQTNSGPAVFYGTRANRRSSVHVPLCANLRADSV